MKTELETIKESIEQGEVIVLTSFFKLFLIHITALASPIIIACLIYYNWNGWNVLTIFLMLIFLFSIVVSTYFYLATGSVVLKGNVLTIKRNFRRTSKVKVDELQGVSERFINRSLSTTGTRITRINYIAENGKPRYVLILDGSSILVELELSVIDILELARGEE